MSETHELMPSHREARLERRSSWSLDHGLLAQLRDSGPRQGGVERLPLRVGGRTLLFDVGRICWVDAARNYVRIHFDEGSFRLRSTLGGLERQLDPQRFVRIHRSTIVNCRRIREVEATGNGEYLTILDNGRRLTLSRSYRRRLAAFLGAESWRAGCSMVRS